MDLKVFFGNAAIVCTVASFFSGAFVCKKIWRKGSSADISPFPFLAGVLCGVLWLRYGLFVKDPVVISVNTIGLLFQTIYVLWYYVFTLNKSTLHRQLLGTVILLGGLFYYLIYLTKDESSAIQASGLMASASSLMFCAAPFASLADVIKTKSVENLPFPIIISTFVVTSLWFIYGFLLNDKYIQVPNFIGCLLALFQLSLFAIYPSKRHNVDNEKCLDDVA
ncbi:sugar transporter SWEET1-like isoform X1 [Limulus polyphemus]|uniref:Sugar transporter SWEET n=2 Tax=Limulus polyphemus TaxID=6850 RepID=A0ABM1T2I0_LIMPO|nr:sugar transporter SWEET1-like isoform X1 [Limulus polyphemus]